MIGGAWDVGPEEGRRRSATLSNLGTNKVIERRAYSTGHWRVKGRSLQGASAFSAICAHALPIEEMRHLASMMVLKGGMSRIPGAPTQLRYWSHITWTTALEALPLKCTLTEAYSGPWILRPWPFCNNYLH